MGLLKQAMNRDWIPTMFKKSAKIFQLKELTEEADLMAMAATGRRADRVTKELEERALLAKLIERFPEMPNLFNPSNFFGERGSQMRENGAAVVQEDDVEFKADLSERFTEAHHHHPPNPFLGIAALVLAVLLGIAAIIAAMNFTGNNSGEASMEPFKVPVNVKITPDGKVTVTPKEE